MERLIIFCVLVAMAAVGVRGQCVPAYTVGCRYGGSSLPSQRCCTNVPLYCNMANVCIPCKQVNEINCVNTSATSQACCPGSTCVSGVCVGSGATVATQTATTVPTTTINPFCVRENNVGCRPFGPATPSQRCCTNKPLYCNLANVCIPCKQLNENCVNTMATSNACCKDLVCVSGVCRAATSTQLTPGTTITGPTSTMGTSSTAGTTTMGTSSTAGTTTMGTSTVRTTLTTRTTTTNPFCVPENTVGCRAFGPAPPSQRCCTNKPLYCNLANVCIPCKQENENCVNTMATTDACCPELVCVSGVCVRSTSTQPTMGTTVSTMSSSLSTGTAASTTGSSTLNTGTAASTTGSSTLNGDSSVNHGVIDVKHGDSSVNHGVIDVKHGDSSVNHGVIDVKHGDSSVNHGVIDIKHGDSSVNHGVIDIKHGDSSVNHGVIDIKHGDRSVNHGVIDIKHGDSSVIHGVIILNHRVIVNNRWTINIKHGVIDTQHGDSSVNHGVIILDHRVIVNSQ
ncbi:keratin-associated protein 10-6-like [Pomacea canaliculata]|uniref:keratin-associated protein 10-6-like n=1 Tax=Pomacea canaliculata TaxID=400727 RepID=UPI000D73F8BD|nr:keratin-associated protein 10-6-like [Pomacea canaliculata]